MRSHGVERVILGLFPAGFRDRFGREWLQAIEFRREAFGRSVSGRIRFALHVLADSSRSVAEAHWLVFRERWRGSRGTDGARAAGPAAPGGGRGSFAGSLSEDVRQVVRGLLRSPLFLLASVSSIALAVAAITAIFSVVDGVLLTPLPYREPDRLAIIWNEFPESGLSRLPLSGVGIEELRAEPGLFEGVGGIWATTRTLSDGGPPIQVSAGLVTPDFFDVLGVGAAVGKLWSAGGGEPVPEGIVLSDAIWRSQFGGDPGAIGRRVRINGTPGTILGVLPPAFRLHFPPDGSIPLSLDVWVPLPWDLTLLAPDQHFLRVIGRMRPGVAAEGARDGVRRAAERARSKYAELTATGDRYSIVPLHDDAVRAARPVLIALMSGVALFLLLASANVGNMLMARSTARRSEMAVRSALGASRGRLARLVAVESLLIGATGGVAGLWLGAGGARLLWAARPAGVATIDTLPMGVRVVACAVAATAVAVLTLGIAPVLSAARVSPHTTLRAAGAARDAGSRTRSFLTVSGIALALVLLVGAALVGQTLVRLQKTDPGFDAGGVLTFRLPLPEQVYGTDADRSRVAAEVERRLNEIPGVLSAGATSHLPLAQWANWADAAPPDGVADEERDTYFVDHRSVTPGYRDALGIRVVAGRWFAPTDGPDSQPVVVLDRTFAARAFPDGDPLGRIVHASRYVGGDFESQEALVVGVVEDVRDVSLARPSAGQVFWPFSQAARWDLTFVLRTASDPLTLREAVEGTVRAVHGGLVPARMTPLLDEVAASTEDARFVALLGAIFSGLALVLAAVGLYGVVMYLASLRVREFGLRLVLGARPAELLRAVLEDGLRLGLSGVAAGLALSVGLTRFIGSMLFDVSPWDPLTLAAVAILLVIVTLVASLVPARRAAGTDPMAVLRSS